MARMFSAGYGLSSAYAEELAHKTTCASCGMPHASFIDVDTDKPFCDTICFTEWFVENEAEEFAKRVARERLQESG